MRTMYLATDGQQFGPYTPEDIAAWYSTGQLAHGTMVWQEGWPNWLSIEVATAGLPAPSVPPPPPRASQRPASHSPKAGAWAVRPDQEVRFASLGRRLGGFALDFLIFYAGLLIALVIGNVAGTVAGPDNAELVTGLVGLPWWLLWIVWTLLGVGRLGQSYGKHLAGVEVQRVDDGMPIGPGAAFGRQIIQALGLWPLGLGWLWALWDPNQQAWHDKAVQSVVVDATDQPRMNPLAHLQATLSSR